MKKGICIHQILRNIFIIIILFWLFSNNSGLMRFIILPFIICVFLSLAKYICIIIGKDKYATIFHKLYAIVFLLFAFCFLMFWSYTVIKHHNYTTLLFTIPFWIMLIYFIRKYFFKKNKKELSNKKESKFNFKIVVAGFLVFSVLASGFLCLFIGIKDMYQFNKKTKNYAVTEGYFKDYDIYNIDKEGTTYKLIYEYEVDGKKYSVSTDYGVEKIPSFNSMRKVKYDPNNYKKAVLVGTNRNNSLIYFGSFFVLGGMVFVLIFLQIKGVFDKTKIDVIGTYIGVTFTIIGIGIILLQNGMTSSFIETIKTMGFWILIPFMFIIVGILLTIRSLVLPKIKKKGNSKK